MFDPGRWLPVTALAFALLLVMIGGWVLYARGVLSYPAFIALTGLLLVVLLAAFVWRLFNR